VADRESRMQYTSVTLHVSLRAHLHGRVHEAPPLGP
jgi:hypothetical protein